MISTFSLNKTAKIWSDYQTRINFKKQCILELNETIRYGSIIHIFKNDVLRDPSGRADYYDKFIVNEMAPRELLRQYREVSTAEEKRHLNTFEGMLDEYRAGLDKNKLLTTSGKQSPVVIDKAVKVNDSPYIEPLKELEVLLEAETIKTAGELSNTVRWTNLILRIIVPIFVIAIILFSRYTIVTISYSIENTINKLKGIVINKDLSIRIPMELQNCVEITQCTEKSCLNWGKTVNC